MFFGSKNTPYSIRLRFAGFGATRPLTGTGLLLVSRSVRFSRGLRLAVMDCLAVPNAKTTNCAIRVPVAVHWRDELVRHCLSESCESLQRWLDLIPFFRVHFCTWTSHDVLVLGPVEFSNRWIASGRLSNVSMKRMMKRFILISTGVVGVAVSVASAGNLIRSHR